jgi:hypothetical protein
MDLYRGYSNTKCASLLNNIYSYCKGVISRTTLLSSLSLRWFPRGGRILVPFLQLIFDLCHKLEQLNILFLRYFWYPMRLWISSSSILCLLSKRLVVAMRTCNSCYGPLLCCLTSRWLCGFMRVFISSPHSLALS